MKGTEKQIAWANDIIDRIETLLKKTEEENNVTDEQILNIHKNIIENMKNDKAWNVIEYFKNINENSTYGELTMRVLAAETNLNKSYRGM